MKYLAFLFIPLTGYYSLISHDWKVFMLILLTFILTPLIELIISSRSKLLRQDQIVEIKNKKIYDLLLYSIVPLQYFLLITFLMEISADTSPWILAVKTLSMGILCGVLGINVAHELGHRHKKSEQWMAQSLLLSSLYMHFFIEHNRGHHKNIGTPHDPVTARLNENIYQFVGRCVPQVFMAAWNLEKNRMHRLSLNTWSWSNQMIRFLTIEILLILCIGLIFGFKSLLFFVIAASIGFILLECIDYIEHYGLKRKELKPGIYESIQAKHSWNSNQILGRVLLFELPLHPAHHKNSSTPYQALQSEMSAPQMPLGYPGMIILALFPKLWFTMINPIATKAML